MPDGASIPFVMHGARAAIAGGMAHIEEQVNSIERAVLENPGLAFDLSKTLIESVCRTVLSEREIPFNPDDDLPALFKMVRNTLPFLPQSASKETSVRRSLEQTLSGLHIAIVGVCELRNQCGFASHGASGPRPALESAQALLAAEAVDTIVGFLQGVHREDRLPPPNPRAEYEDNLDFNGYVDEVYGLIKIFDAEFNPSEVLFQMEPETYRVYLAEFEPESGEEKTDTDKTSTVEESPCPT
jgi:hypothetical protein